MNSFIIFLSFIPFLTIFSHTIKNTNINTNINTNFCKNCKNFFLDKEYPNNFDYGLCKLYYNINLVTGVKKYKSAYNVRYEGECGKIGYFYDPYDLEEEDEKNNIKY